MDEIAEKYAAGRSTAELARRFGAAKSTINIRLKAHGVQLRLAGGRYGWQRCQLRQRSNHGR